MDTIALTPGMAADVDLPAGEEWLCVKGYRINVDDGRPTCWNEYFIRKDYTLIGRLLARHVGPLIPLLEDLFKTPITRITRSISAVRIAAAQAERLGSTSGAPARHVLVRCETADGSVAMTNRSVHPRGTVTYAIKR